MFSATPFSPSVGNLTIQVGVDKGLPDPFLADRTFTSTAIGSAVTGGYYQIGSNQLAITTAPTATGGTNYPAPARIFGILKTPVIFNSVENTASTVYVTYEVRDASGTFLFCPCAPA
jgi:hypothetical protein